MAYCPFFLGHQFAEDMMLVGDLGGSFYCRCEQTQTQKAQYNEFGREADLRTGPL